MVDDQFQNPEKLLRGILPDAVDESFLYLFKACSSLRLTYEIRLGTYMAIQNGLRLCLEVRLDTVIQPDLEAFINQHGVVVNRSLK